MYTFLKIFMPSELNLCMGLWARFTAVTCIKTDKQKPSSASCKHLIVKCISWENIFNILKTKHSTQTKHSSSLFFTATYWVYYMCKHCQGSDLHVSVYSWLSGYKTHNDVVQWNVVHTVKCAEIESRNRIRYITWSINNGLHWEMFLLQVGYISDHHCTFVCVCVEHVWMSECTPSLAVFSCDLILVTVLNFFF